VIYADLITAGNMPDATDLLNSVVINGARRSTLSLSRRVGTPIEKTLLGDH